MITWLTEELTDGLIDIIGLSTFRTEEEMAQRLTPNPKRLWKIPPGTPFPSEMTIDYNPRSGHASIKPANGVSPERFVKVMSVAQCLAHFQAGTSLA